MINEFNIKKQEGYNRVVEHVDYVLWKDWDPIGVNYAGDDARDEYSEYAQRITLMLYQKRPIDEIAKKLYDIETITMHLFRGKENAMHFNREVVIKLVNGFNEIIGE